MAFNARMHERNIYKIQPDFTQIAIDYPEFRKYAIPDAKGQKVRVDFTNTEALRMLTKILLEKDFNLKVCIPEGFLIPTVPQRLNYILWVEDLLSNISKKECISGIDIGTGPCAIFSILGAQKNGWKFVATESSGEAICWASKNVDQNNLTDKIEVFKVNSGSALEEVLSSNDECYDFCMCNPPFFENIEEIRKKHRNSDETVADTAQKEEIFVKGGELDFVRNILKESLVYQDRICLFTSMFGKKKSFLEIIGDLKEIHNAKFTTTEFCQGNTVRWGIAWTFNKCIHLEQEIKKKTKSKKERTPLEYQIPLRDSKKFNLNTIVEKTEAFINTLQIPVTVARSSKNFAELLLKSSKNTWTHQRRKRREIERQNKVGDSLVVAKLSSGEVDLISPQANSLLANSEVEKAIDDCSVDSPFAISKKNQFNTPSSTSKICSPKSPSKGPSQEPDESAFSSTISGTKNEKRKGNVSSDLPETKKVKLDTEIKTTHTLDQLSIIDINFNPKITSDVLITDTKNVDEMSSSQVGNTDQEEGLILNCHLQFIKGNSKIYVKMNCPPAADRNAMYQVFQLIKNKIN